MHGNVFEEGLSGKGMKVALVISRFNHDITSRLKDGCLKSLAEHEVSQDDIGVFHVPGSFEIPVTAKILARSEKYDAIVAIGAVVKGETPHFDYVCKEVADGVSKVSYDHGLPVIFCVVTTNNLAQAEERAKEDKSNKGYEAGLAAIEMVQLMRKIK